MKSRSVNPDAPESKMKLKQLPAFLWQAAKLWNSHNPWRMGAVVAYYAVLSLPGLLVIIVSSVGAIWEQEIIEGEISAQISAAIGPKAAESVIAIFENAQSDHRTVWATILGVAILVFGATGVFYHLQLSMNEIWNVKVDPKAGIVKVLKARATSLAFIMVLLFLLIISLVASTFLSVLNDYLSNLWQPAYVVLTQSLEMVISTLVLGVLFVLIFKYMPDLKIPWKSVWIGGFLTAILFNVGKMLLNVYFGQAEPGSTYGAAGSVVLILLWVSYSCLILFYGAAFTRVMAENLNHGIETEAQSLIVEKKEVVVERGSDSAGD